MTDTERRKEQHKKAAARYRKTEKGRITSRKAAAKQRKTDKGCATRARYVLSLKGQKTIAVYANSNARKAVLSKYNKSDKGRITRLEQGRKNRWRNREVVRKLKDAPCVDCGIRYPDYVMQFDHIPERGPKLGEINRLVCGSLKRLLAEIEKCEVVCANCHYTRTHFRKQHLTTVKKE